MRFAWILLALSGIMDLALFTLGFIYPNVYHHGAEDYAWMAYIAVVVLVGLAFIRIVDKKAKAEGRE